MKLEVISLWAHDRTLPPMVAERLGSLNLKALGNLDLLIGHKTALICSARTPGDALLRRIVEEVEFAYINQCEGVAAGSVQDILGCSAKTAKDLQTEIARLEPWQIIARSQQKTEEFIKFTAEAFYKSYT